VTTRLIKRLHPFCTILKDATLGLIATSGLMVSEKKHRLSPDWQGGEWILRAHLSAQSIWPTEIWNS